MDLSYTVPSLRCQLCPKRALDFPSSPGLLFHLYQASVLHLGITRPSSLLRVKSRRRLQICRDDLSGAAPCVDRSKHTQVAPSTVLRPLLGHFHRKPRPLSAATTVDLPDPPNRRENVAVVAFKLLVASASPRPPPAHGSSPSAAHRPFSCMPPRPETARPAIWMPRSCPLSATSPEPQLSPVRNITGAAAPSSDLDRELEDVLRVLLAIELGTVLHGLLAKPQQLASIKL